LPLCGGQLYLAYTVKHSIQVPPLFTSGFIY